MMNLEIYQKNIEDDYISIVLDGKDCDIASMVYFAIRELSFAAFLKSAAEHMPADSSRSAIFEIVSPSGTATRM